MPTRFLARNLLIAALSALPAVVFAEPVQPGAVSTAGGSTDIETSKFSFLGEVNADNTLVRCGPSENDYQVLKLAKGTRLTVVGMRLDWLKIVPPEGSYCLVPQAFIDKTGDGKTGRVINKAATVRVGSALTQAMYKVLPKQLEPGTDVQILGETPTQEFYKIAPPRDVFMYVDKRYVNPVKRNEAESAKGQIVDAKPLGTTPQVTTPEATPDATPPTDTATTEQPQPGTIAQTPEGATPADPNHFVARSTPPESSLSAVANADATAAAVRVLQEKLSKLEDRYAAAGQQQDLGTQSIEDLAKDYDTLLADKQLPPNARKVAEFRSGQLKLRKEALVEFALAKKAQEEAAQKQKDLKAEQEELAARVAAQKITHYAATGRLLQSSLQIGGQTLYRLVDPANSRLILYVRGGNVPVGANLDKFVAINGKIVKDEAINITYVQPESCDVVDPKEMNSHIFADFAPQSMSTSNMTREASAQ
jgi:hypothetical protein